MTTRGRMRQLFADAISALKPSKTRRLPGLRHRAVHLEPLEKRELLTTLNAGYWTPGMTDLAETESSTNYGYYAIWLSDLDPDFYAAGVSLRIDTTQEIQFQLPDDNDFKLYDEDLNYLSDEEGYLFSCEFDACDTGDIFYIYPKEDSEFEGTMDITVSTESWWWCTNTPGDTYSFSSGPSATISIDDDDEWLIEVTQTGDGKLGEPDYDETFTVERRAYYENDASLDSSYPISVGYSFSGDAAYGTDYHSSLGCQSGYITLSGAGSQTVTVTVDDDHQAEKPEEVNFNFNSLGQDLSGCCNGVGVFPVLGTSATMTLNDNDWLIEWFCDAVEPAKEPDNSTTATYEGQGEIGVFWIHLEPGNTTYEDTAVSFTPTYHSSGGGVSDEQGWDDDELWDNEPTSANGDADADAICYHIKISGEKEIITTQTDLIVKKGEISTTVIVAAGYDELGNDELAHGEQAEYNPDDPEWDWVEGKISGNNVDWTTPTDGWMTANMAIRAPLFCLSSTLSLRNVLEFSTDLKEKLDVEKAEYSSGTEGVDCSAASFGEGAGVRSVRRMRDPRHPILHLAAATFRGGRGSLRAKAEQGEPAAAA